MEQGGLDGGLDGSDETRFATPKVLNICGVLTISDITENPPHDEASCSPETVNQSDKLSSQAVGSEIGEQ